VSGTTLLAGTYSGGVFHSTDQGVTWVMDATQPTGARIYTLLVHGTNAFAGTYAAGIWRKPL
jgi:hypothetical protein